jgi:SpoVK/Ycf46/Vps4 family AAA+-type ATPase
MLTSAVFLRLLEYYEGLMILTTNRVSAFDTAFKSRIHLAIKYPALSFESRRNLWTTFITSGDTHPWPFWMDDSFLDSLAAENLNGRQIKNVVRMANALAIAEGGDLRPKNIRMSLKSIKDFEEDFAAEDTTETAGHGGSPTSEHRAKRQRRG